MKTDSFLFGKMERERREVASLTKIMTCLVVLNLLKKYDLDETNTMIEISEFAANISGTSAELEAGDYLSVWDLLHGLMLPSGNDAALALAEFFGAILVESKKLELLDQTITP
jgi:D-alanyl-D-alanine carboxypeptidase